MAATSPSAAPPLPLLLLLLALLAPAPPRASAYVFSASSYALVRQPLTNMTGAAASLDLLAAEAAAAQQLMAAAAAQAAEAEETDAEAEATEAPPPDGWEVWEEEAPPPGGAAGAAPTPLSAAPPPPPSPPPPVPAPLDALLDFSLGAVSHELLVNHSAEQPVPDFDKDFRARVGPFKVHGHLKASGGTAGDLSSLFRDGSVTLRQEAGGVLLLEAAAGLRHLRLRFRHYQARAGPVRVSGLLEAEMSPATLRVQLELVPPCSVRLRSLQVAKVGPLRVRATGLGVLRRLLPLLQRWLDKRMRSDVENIVLQHLTQIIQGEMQRVSCK